MKSRNAKVFINLGWATLASYFLLLWMDNHGKGVGGGLRLLLGGLMWVCFAAYGSIANEYFTFPGLKNLCHFLVPGSYSPAFTPRVMAKVDAYHRGDVDLDGLVDAVVTKANILERHSALEYLCLIAIPEQTILDSLGAGASSEIRQDIHDVYKNPSWRKVYNFTAMFTMAALFALVANYSWAKALLAAPGLAVLKVLVGDKWTGK
jgi:hypothetical protein